MKRLILISVLVTITSLVFGLTRFTVDGINYTTTGTNTVQVSSGGACKDTIMIPSSVTYLGITYSVTSIGNNAFSACNNLRSISLPNTITSIGDYAFSGCTFLNDTLQLPTNLISIGISAFQNCNQLTGNLIIPSKVTEIKPSAFAGCSGLKGAFNIPNTVTSIDDGAFSGCSGLTGNLNIPSNVTVLGASAFQNCSGFNGSLTLSTSLITISDNAFNGCSKLSGNLIIPGTISSIGASSFSGCSGFTGNLNLPNSVTLISDGAFSGCSGLNGSITLPTTLSSISLYVFSGCNNFTTLNIPNSVTRIRDGAFSDCTKLSEITIHKNDSSIRDYAFNNCTGLTKITVENTTPPQIFSTTFNGVSKEKCTIVVPPGASTTYQLAKYWSDFFYYSELCLLFTANAGADKSLICGGLVQLDSVTTNYTGTDKLRYKWSPSIELNSDTIPNPICSANGNTTYVIEVFTPYGCSAIDSVKVIVNPLTVNAGGDKTIICGGVAQLGKLSTNYTGNGTLKYKWIPSIGLNNDTIVNPTSTISENRTYNVTVTTPNGCSAVDTVKVIVNPLTASAGADKSLICGGSVQLDNVTTNYTGTGKLRYKWSPSIGLNSDTIVNPTVTITSNTVYIVTVTTPNGCSAIDTVKVVVNPLTASAGADKSLICGGSVQLDNVTTNYTGTGKLRYKWSPSIGLNSDTIVNPTVTITSNTVYIVTVTTPNGCSAIDSVKVIVNPLTASAGADKSLICGGSVQLDNVTTNYTGTGKLRYKWLPSSGLNSDTIANPIANITSNVKYTVTVTNPNACTASDDVQVTVNSLTVNAGSDNSVVCGNIVQLSATSNYSGIGKLRYKWTPSIGLSNDSISNPFVSTFKQIDYTVTVITPNGCMDSDVVNVKPTMVPSQQIRLVGVDSINKNMIVWNNISSSSVDSVIVYKETGVTDVYEKIGIAPYTQMYFSDTLSNPTIVSNKYEIALKDKCGFESSTSDPHKTIHLSIGQGQGNTWNLAWEPYIGFTVSSYIIYRGTSQSNLSMLYTASGSVYQYFDNNPPVGYVYYQVEVVPPSSQFKAPGEGIMKSAEAINLTTSRSNIATNNITGISNVSYNDLFSIYPNPTSSEVTISVQYNTISSVKIYNMVGDIVKTSEINANSLKINVSDLPNNLYIIEVSSGNVIGRQKLVINR